jgi:hypothetical protein
MVEIAEAGGENVLLDVSDFAAPPAAGKARRFSVRAGPVIMSVSIHFRPASPTKHNPRSASMLLSAWPPQSAAPHRA